MGLDMYMQASPRHGVSIRCYVEDWLLDLKDVWEKYNMIVDLLGKIRAKYGIDFEIVHIKSREDVRKIYERDFASRAKLLSRRIGERVSRALKSRSGNIYLHGRIALTRSGAVEWFVNYADEWRRKWEAYDKDIELGFLRAVLNEGPKLLYEILGSAYSKDAARAGGKAKKDHEELAIELINLVRDACPEAHIEREVSVGAPVIFRTAQGELIPSYHKKIDIVIRFPSNRIWVVEVKNELNAEALGQAIIYKELYLKEKPGERVESVIVCQHASEDLVEIGKRHVDHVLVLREIYPRVLVDVMDGRSYLLPHSGIKPEDPRRAILNACYNR